MLLIARAGLAGAGRLPNTASAVDAAFAAGASGVELDVRLTQDGVPVCCRDAHLGGMSTAPVAVSAASWRDLRAVPLHGGDRIERLDEVVEAVPDGATLVVLLRPSPRSAAAVVTRTLAVASRRIEIDVSSFSAAPLRELQRYGASFGTALCGFAGTPLDELADEARRNGCTAIHPHVESALAGATAIADLTSCTVEVLARHVDRPVDVACLAVTGISGIVTDDLPAALDGVRRPLTGLASAAS
jgi:glycerophosphoryl diester phosphodiesterase